MEIFGHQAILTTSGSEAVQLAIQEKPDLVITDLSLADADTDGLDVLAGLQSNPATASIPVVVHSARSDKFIRLEVQTAGAAAYVVKPVKLMELRDLIDQLTRI